MTGAENPERSAQADMPPAPGNLLAEIAARIEIWLAAPGGAPAPEAVRDGLRDLSASLHATHWCGALAFCSELEAVLDELCAQPDMLSNGHGTVAAPNNEMPRPFPPPQPSPGGRGGKRTLREFHAKLHRDTLRGALGAFARHLDALTDGADDVALRLFPEYRALQQMRGLETSFELDLFHPDTDVQLPQQVLDAPQEEDAAHRLRLLRSQYQQGLAHWLRKDDVPAALQIMRQALDGALRCMPQDGSRTFWWVACGLLDCLLAGAVPAGVNVARLLGRIDQQMRAAGSSISPTPPLLPSEREQTNRCANPTLDEMLYLIGKSGAADGLPAEIRDTFMLEYYLPGFAAVPPGDAAQILEALHGQLRATEAIWERCAQGNRAAGAIFVSHTRQLAELGGRLGDTALRYLTAQIHALAQDANSRGHAPLIALDMAMALLLLESGIRHHGHLHSGFLKQARILSARIEAAARQQPEDARQLDELVRLHALLQRGDVRLHLFNEMLANLRYVSEGLNAFFGDLSARNELDELLRLTSQIQGGLRIASLEHVERLLASVQGNMRCYAQGGDVPEAGEAQALSAALAALEEYLRRLAQGQPGDAAFLQTAQEGMAGLRSLPPAAPEPQAAPAGLPGEAAVDQELLEVFLEEAQDVLHAMRNNLEACRVKLDRESLVNIRRGFHTLKGSGRMVGLTELGDVAWSVERALNKWLQDNRPPVPGLLDFVAAAEERFSGWVDALNSQGGVTIEAMDLAVIAMQIENGIVPEPMAGQPMEQADMAPSAPGGEGGERALDAFRAEETAPPEEAPAPAPVQPAAPAPAATEKLPVRDDLDAQLLPVFLEEADGLLPQIGARLRAWREQPGDERHPQQLKRMLHTFKGSARMAGAMRIGSMLHEMEEQALSAVRQVPWDVLESGLDNIASLLEELRGGMLTGQREAGYAGVERRKKSRAPEEAAEHAMLRVRASLLDRLAGEAGEIGMTRVRMETEMRAFKEGLHELTGSVARLRKQLRELEIQAESRMQARNRADESGVQQFDPLEFDRFTRLQELTRFMNESVHDVQTVQRALLKNFDETAAALAAQARLNRELQQHLLSARMVPLASIAERLYRVVRQTAKELGKRANLELSGAELELDRNVLERMTAPFEHLLRNALAHGIESEAARVQSGKNPVGEIRLGLRHAGNEVVFEFGDDGAGLDFAALRDRAAARGLLKPGEAASDERLKQLLFTSGISTAAGVTETAGRGVGMDVVCSEITALGGRIEVDSRHGQGTRFTIHLPLTLAVTHVLMVQSGNAAYAVPSATVEQVREVKSEELARLYRAGRVEWQGNIYPLHYLPRLLGEGAATPENRRHNPVLLLRSGEQRIALHVDGLLGNQEAMLKNTGPQLAQLPVVAGATVQGDGVVALILNPAQLALRAAAGSGAATEAAPEMPRVQPLVMVVDDSLTVRKVTTRLLSRAGYRVATAIDGMEALEQLAETLPDVMLLDIEMPRMDGFELTKHLRREARTQGLPIIMITSRAADKHREHALQLGVNAYLGKPYQEEELLAELAAFAPLP